MIKKILLTDYKTLSPFDSTDFAAGILKKDSFIVINEDDKFYGLLTAEDLIFNRKILIGDTVKQKPFLKSTDSIQEALNMIIESKVDALPCIEEDICIGVLTKEKAFSSLFKISLNENSSINITNIIGNSDEEAVKSEFLKTFCHYSKNHLQILFSGFKLLEDSTLNEEQKEILESMYSATNKMNVVMANYLEYYFSDEIIAESRGNKI